MRAELEAQIASLTARLTAAERERDVAVNRLRPAEALADAVAAYVQIGLLDARSRPADALLDYREPPVTEQTTLLAKAERELSDRTRERDEARVENVRWRESDRLRALLAETKEEL